MDAEALLSFEPSELSFPFELNKQLSSSIRLLNETVELNKQLSSSIRLLNETDDYVAFKLLSTNPRNYVVRPRIGILLPGSTCDISVTTTRVLRDAPQNMRCKDKFMIRSAVATPSSTLEDAPRMFDRESGHSFHECILRVVYNMPTESSLATPDIENSDSHVHEATDSVVETQDNDLQMSTRKLLDVQPPELQLPLILNKELSCSIQLSNATDHHVAFRVKTASSKYFIQPDVGILLPQSKCDINARKQVESNDRFGNIQNEDKLLIQSVLAPVAETTENTSMDLFDKENSCIEECEVKVVYVSGQKNDSSDNGELILWSIINGLLVLVVLVSMYLMKQIISWIWSLTMIAMMLMVKMVKKLVSDSVEDWIVKTLLYIFWHILFGRKENISLS